LQVLGCVGDALPDLAGDVVHGALALSKHVDDFSAPATCQCPSDNREPVVQRAFRGSVAHGQHDNYSNEHLTRPEREETIQAID
jgi:hypothetical protein